ncbi:inorganic diphosphatase [Aliihoeflea aestuarii]|jgi:inorganic pyrophosphatase|uniref:inorganic diphosphatase n=1 Tax=Aliihoeflea aestuarii TaxID=453840 RepID=UPI002092AD22|nr:inorganic diphosphatase [Aliihoeflea aestuarii]MCO6390579.1 inorganic diphosphatase [Aliihoeflea aestuarii]
MHARTTLTTLALATIFMLAGAQAQEYVAPFAYPQPEEDGEFNTLIEIPAGEITKYEVDADTGHLIVDRYMSMPVAYPTNYGSIPSSLGGDGDPLDALVITRVPVVPGAMIRVRAIGIMKMIDGGEQDDKIVAVPVSDVDPTYDAIREMEDLPEMERNRLEAFFRVYKDLPEGSKVIELGGYDSAEAAGAAISEAISNYRAQATE